MHPVDFNGHLNMHSVDINGHLNICIQWTFSNGHLNMYSVDINGHLNMHSVDMVMAHSINF